MEMLTNVEKKLECSNYIFNVAIKIRKKITINKKETRAEITCEIRIGRTGKTK